VKRAVERVVERIVERVGERRGERVERVVEDEEGGSEVVNGGKLIDKNRPIPIPRRKILHFLGVLD